MADQENTTRSRILQAASREFLDKGFQTASLRSIVKQAGVTTGAFYGYFRSKEELFDALVQEPYEHLLGLYHQIQTSFQQLPPQSQKTDMLPYTKTGIRQMTDYIYDHLPAFRLILCCSEGTRYESMVHDMAMIDVNATHDFTRTMEQMGVPIKKVNPQLEHMLTSGMFSAYFELIIHQIPRQEANEYIAQLMDFYSAGWQKIMGF